MSRTSFNTRSLLKVWDLPLLAKEFIEQAARRRTYALRVIVAFVGLLFFLALYVENSSGAGPGLTLGVGGAIYSDWLAFQVFGLMVLVPLMLCGTVAYERERGSLALLMLTALGPWHIVVQKYLSRLIPLLSLLLVLMPMSAVCYQMGGLPGEELLDGCLVVLYLLIQLSAVSICCSVLCKTTVRAVMANYLMLALFVLVGFSSGCEGWIWRVMEFFLPAFSWNTTELFGKVHVWQWGIVPVYLSFAGWVLKREGRKSTPKKEGWLRWFRKRRGEALPSVFPLSWLAVKGDRLGVSQKWSRLPVLLWLTIFGVGMGIPLTGRQNFFQVDDNLLWLNLAVWGFAALAMGFVGSGLFNQERDGQTLDVLLTSEITAREILRQKSVVLGWYHRFFFWALMLLMFSRLAFYMMCDLGYYRNIWGAGVVFSPAVLLSPQEMLLFLGKVDLHLRFMICVSLSIWVYLNLAGWVAVWIGLKIKHRMQSMAVMLGVLVGWNLLPLLFYALVHTPLRPFASLSFLSPLCNIVAIDQPAGMQARFSVTEAVCLPVLAMIAARVLAWRIEAKCFRNAEKWLRA